LTWLRPHCIHELLRSIYVGRHRFLTPSQAHQQEPKTKAIQARKNRTQKTKDTELFGPGPGFLPDSQKLQGALAALVISGQRPSVPFGKRCDLSTGSLVMYSGMLLISPEQLRIRPRWHQKTTRPTQVPLGCSKPDRFHPSHC